MNGVARGRERLAIIGIGCRFPGGADTPSKLWDLLRQGIDAVSEIPSDRWDVESLYDPDYRSPGRSVQRHGGFVDRIREFDAAFFGISPREARRIDPQQRMLLEAAHRALEDAGIPAFGLGRSATGVFVGIATHDYADLQARPHEHPLSAPHGSHGGALSIAANRISYVFDLRGPSLAIDTACSSTLYALHAANLAIRNGDCDLALVGGVNALLMPGPVLGFSRGMFLSARGRCQAFSAHADGFVRAEGAGIVVIKPLSRAVADGDRIYAVIRDTAVNEDGRTEGMALPSFDAQAALIERAYASAGLDPRDVGYVEAHGTGTVVGDEIEARSIGTVIGRGRPVEQLCLLGSVKTNLGHLEAGAAVAGLIKLALCLHHREIPRSLHSEELSPKIPFSDLRLEVVRDHRAWPEWNRPPLAGLNSFGFGGANAHAILEAAPAASDYRTPATGPIVAALSARSDDALRELARGYLGQPANHESSLHDIAYSTIRRRDHHPVRAAIVASDGRQWKERLEALSSGQSAPGVIVGHARATPAPVAFVCSGQGPQWWAMGRELFTTDRVFREAIEKVDGLLRPLAPWGLIEEVFERDEAISQIDETWLTQPALFALQIALAERWRSLGIEPAAVVGHSVGEVAAAVIAGALPLETGTFVIYHRSRIQAEAAGAGRMLAVGLAEGPARRRIAAFEGRVSIAAINRPELVTLSGDTDAIESLARDLTAEDIFHRFLAVNVPFHSHHMDPLRDPLVAALGSVRAGEAGVALYSTVTGRRMKGPEFCGEYWFRNVREPVRFAAAVRSMIREGHRLFIELSPHPILSPGVEDLMREANADGVALPSLRRGSDDSETLLASVGALYVRGHAIAPAQPGRFVDLPFNPWQRESFWCESEEGRIERLASRPHPLVRRRRSSFADANRHVFNLEFDLHVERWLAEHKLQHQIVVPGAALIEAALACGRDAFAEDVFLEDIAIEHALFLTGGDEDLPPDVQLEVDGDDGQFAIVSRGQGGETTRHVRGFLRHRGEPVRIEAPRAGELLERCSPLGEPGLYPVMAECGVQIGPLFETLRDIRGRVIDESHAEVFARVSLDPAVRTARYFVHPLLLDACFQSLCAVPFLFPSLGARVYIPAAARRVYLRKTSARDCRICTRISKVSDRRVLADLWLLDDAGDVAAEVHGFEGRLLDGSERSLRPDDHYYELRWIPADRPDQKRNRQSSILLARPELVQEAIREREDALKTDLTNATRAAVDARLDRLALAHIIGGLTALGVVWEPDRRFAVALPAVSPKPDHRRLLLRILRAVEDAGLIEIDAKGTEFRVLRSADLESVEALQPALTIEDDAGNDAALIGDAGRNLVAVLRGEREGVEVLFAPAVMRRLGIYYREHYHMKQSLGLLAAAFRALVTDLPADRTLRVLELGAGTGSATEVLFPELPAERTEYFFTDVSSSFFADAKARLGHSNLQFAVLDLERDLDAQGFNPGSFDIVIASNVLHATSDLRATLRRLRWLLGNGGSLVATEITRASLALDLVFGLTDGWWSFQDNDSRLQHASLDSDGWRRAFAETGFASVIAATYQQDEQRHCGQHLLVARHPGNGADTTVDSLPFDLANGESGSVVIVGEGALGDRLKRRFQAAGLAAEAVEPSGLADTLLSMPKPVRAVVDVEAAALVGRDLSSADLPDMHSRTTKRQMAIAVHLARSETNAAPRLVLVTCNAAAVADDATVNPAQAPVWGVGRTIANEYTHLHVRLVDLPAEPGDVEVEALAQECLTDCDDVDIALRGERRFALRVERVPEDKRVRPARPGESFRLEIDRRGVLETIAFRKCARAPLAPDAVEIEVKAAALNFRDVMNAMGLLPTELEMPVFGLECSGVVSRTGNAVSDLQPGDEVIAFCSAALARYTIAPRLAVVRKPRNLSYADAATVPAAFGTAWYCLEEVGRLRAGERVLIHAATGGVGHAAIQIARRRGAEIFATAGTEAKRAYLRDMGIQHVFDSRSIRWVEEVRAATAGKGIDLILNSLSGSAIPRGLELLSPMGRFVEIGVTDIFENRRIGLGAFRRATSYIAVELDLLFREQPEVLQRRVLEPLVALLESGELKALPTTVFRARDVAEAFQLMSRSHHRGKVVVSFESEGPVPIVAEPEPFVLDGRRTYLVTGGTRGFGFSLAEWLIERGARHLVLISRTGHPEDEAARKIDRWRADGIAVRVSAVDVGDEAAVAAELALVRREMPPIGGVIHAALVLADAPISTLDDAKFMSVLGPKAGGALNLDRLTREDDLSFFLLLSSLSGVIGNGGQANYNAANLMLEAIAHRRRLEGLPATVTQLGIVADVGVIARNETLRNKLERLAVTPTPPAVLLALIERSLREHATVRLAGIFGATRMAVALPSCAARLSRLVDAGSDRAGKGSGLLAEIGQLSVESRTPRLTSALVEAVARITGADAAKVPPDLRLTDIGLDSLMATQLSSWVQATLGVNVPPMRLLKGPTLAELACELAPAIGSDAGSPDSARAKLDVAAATSCIQAAIFADHALLPGSAVLSTAAIFEGTFDEDAARRSFERLVQRHALLRSRFTRSDGELRREDLDGSVAWTTVDVGSERELGAGLAADAIRPFDLEREAPVRALLSRLSPTRGVLQITAHHLAYDGTFPLVWDELLALYRMEIGEAEADLPPAESYDRFIAFERDYLTSSRSEEDRRYWHQKLVESSLRLNLGSVSRERADDWLMATVPVPLGVSLSAALHRFAAEREATPYAVLATSYLLALQTEAQIDDLIVGSSVSLRDLPELQELVGPLINFIALRVDLSGRPAFDEALDRVRHVIAEALDHRLYPFGMLVEELADPAELALMPRLGLNVNFNYYNLDGLVRDSESARLRRSGFVDVGGGAVAANYPVQGFPVARPYDLTLGVFQIRGDLSAALRYNVRLFEASRAARIARTFLDRLGEAVMPQAECYSPPTRLR